MSGAGVFSAVLLGASLIVSAIKLLNWWISTDPKSLIQTGRWLTLALAMAAVAGTAVLLVNRQWTPAMVVGAGILIAASFVNWRALNPFRSRFRPAWSRVGMPPDSSAARRPADPELVARAAAVLESYLAEVRATGVDQSIGSEHASNPNLRGPAAWQDRSMSRQEALEILDLRSGASANEVRDAHRRLVQLIHPDRGGSKYLAAKVNQAKDILLQGERLE